MQCPCCEITRRELYCASCLQEGYVRARSTSSWSTDVTNGSVNGHTAIKHDLAGQVAQARTHAERLLTGPIDGPAGELAGAEAWREMRANVATAEARVAVLRERIAKASEEAERSELTDPGCQLTAVRASTLSSSAIRQRREKLDAAVQAVPSVADMNARIVAVRQQQREVGKRIIQARKVLVREAVDVFGVQRTKGWEIAGLELPPPDHFRCRLPPPGTPADAQYTRPR